MVIFSVSTWLPPLPPPSHPNMSRRWSFSAVSTRLPPPPPPSRSNASWRWSFLAFQHVRHHHHLPCTQTRAEGDSFQHFATNSTTTSSLASKREPEVVNFSVLTRLPPPPPPLHPNVSGGGPFCHFDVPPTTTSSLASKCAGGGLFRRFQGVCHRRHITTARESTMAKMDKRGRG